MKNSSRDLVGKELKEIRKLGNIIHMANIVKQWADANAVDILSWPDNSPD